LFSFRLGGMFPPFIPLNMIIKIKKINEESLEDTGDYRSFICSVEELKDKINVIFPRELNRCFSDEDSVEVEIR